MAILPSVILHFSDLNVGPESSCTNYRMLCFSSVLNVTLDKDWSSCTVWPLNC